MFGEIDFAEKGDGWNSIRRNGRFGQNRTMIITSDKKKKKEKEKEEEEETRA